MHVHCIQTLLGKVAAAHSLKKAVGPKHCNSWLLLGKVKVVETYTLSVLTLQIETTCAWELE